MKAEARPTFVPWSGLLGSVELLLILLLVLLVYREVLPPLVMEWYEHENFSYGFLIPLIFAYLVWDKRSALGGFAWTWSPWGSASLAIALLIGLVGQTMGEPFLSRISFVLTVGALVHLFGGWRGLRVLAFPLAYLLFMVPPPYPLVKAVSYHLKMFDARIAEMLLPLAGVPTYRDAYFLHLPNIVLEVADVCSGIASFFAMAALGVLYAYHLPVNLIGKLLLLAGAMIFPILANLFRILLIGISVYYYGPVMLGAFFHSFTGTFTFLLSLAMTLVLGEWIRRCAVFASTGEINQRPIRGDDRVSEYAADRGRSRLWQRRPFICALCLLTAGAWISQWSRVAAYESPGLDFSLIPRAFNTYQASAVDSEDFYRDPYADKTISRLYRNAAGNEIEVFVGYRQRQSGSDRLRSPKLVFPKGWEYASLGPLEIALGNGQAIEAMWVETRKGPARKLVVFWYRMRGRSFASDVSNRVELLRGLLLHKRTDGAVVRLATDVKETETIDGAKRRLASFAVLLHPEIARLLPN